MMRSKAQVFAMVLLATAPTVSTSGQSAQLAPVLSIDSGLYETVPAVPAAGIVVAPQVLAPFLPPIRAADSRGERGLETFGAYFRNQPPQTLFGADPSTGFFFLAARQESPREYLSEADSSNALSWIEFDRTPGLWAGEFAPPPSESAATGSAPEVYLYAIAEENENLLALTTDRRSWLGMLAQLSEGPVLGIDGVTTPLAQSPAGRSLSAFSRIAQPSAFLLALDEERALRRLVAQLFPDPLADVAAVPRLRAPWVLRGNSYDLETLGGEARFPLLPGGPGRPKMLGAPGGFALRPVLDNNGAEYIAAKLANPAAFYEAWLREYGGIRRGDEPGIAEAEDKLHDWLGLSVRDEILPLLGDDVYLIKMQPDVITPSWILGVSAEEPVLLAQLASATGRHFGIEMESRRWMGVSYVRGELPSGTQPSEIFWRMHPSGHFFIGFDEPAFATLLVALEQSPPDPGLSEQAQFVLQRRLASGAADGPALRVSYTVNDGVGLATYRVENGAGNGAAIARLLLAGP